SSTSEAAMGASFCSHHSELSRSNWSGPPDWEPSMNCHIWDTWPVSRQHPQELCISYCNAGRESESWARLQKRTLLLLQLTPVCKCKMFFWPTCGKGHSRARFRHAGSPRVSFLYALPTNAGFVHDRKSFFQS